MVMQKIVPHLWFDKEAKDAAAFYASIFPKSKVNNVTVLRDTPSGDTDVVSFELWNHKFMAISAGPDFKFTPAVSFIVNFDPLLFDSPTTREKDAREKLDMVWNRLSEGGTVLMPIDKYPFSDRYGWIQDKYGLSWQLILGKPDGEPRPAIIPSLLFVGNRCGKAEEAINFYLKVFKNPEMGAIHRYGKDQAPDKEGTVMFADFLLENVWFAAMDSAGEHKFDFNEAVSFIVRCADQGEIDTYWQKLSAVRESEQCGWLKDRYGVSWQITPFEMQEMMTKGTREQVERLTRAFMPMKKLDIAKLKQAYEGKLAQPA
jgi:predicted 3-demethylubiquinone-9 3-methyltransferase (glyoxalase superfamily)